jgi:hypothetical protein
MIECTIHPGTEDMRGKRLLVFLCPQALQKDCLIHAW